MSEYTENITVRVTEEMDQTLAEIAEIEGKSQSDIVRELLKLSLQQGGVIDPHTQLQMLDQQIEELEKQRRSLKDSLDSLPQ